MPSMWEVALQRIAAQSEPNELTRYPNLRDRMMEAWNETTLADHKIYLCA